ncbi:hypothetical protein RB195_019456 [Necator americanus]|uniref:Endonuclease/exonuclease/phosphatase domain-containing protein n=1 Tax=Necator americanus TaxID=51031 RepID=A0ABR1CGB4_NECAM
MTSKTIHGISQFEKPFSLRWTWESPGGGYRNETDHIIVNKRFCLTDVAVVPEFYMGSDHRLLRGRFSFTRRAEKAAEYERLVEHLHEESEELQNHKETPVSKNSRADTEAIKEDLKERRAKVLAEAVETG